MEEDINLETEVILEIENTPVKCNKQELMNHSDYFKVMFEGNFIERNKKVVQLEGITLEAVNAILRLLWNRDDIFLLNNEDLLISVLQASCMLQFLEIKTMCIDRLTHVLVPSNCLKIWLFTEQLDLRPLYLKAKNMALTEFETVKDSEYLLELDLRQLHSYLANINLQCKSELAVFEVCMRWWYEHSQKLTVGDLKAHCTATFLSLLSCVDFNNFSNSNIQEVMMYPDVSQNDQLMDILSCIIDLRMGGSVNYKECVRNKAKILSNSKSRCYKRLPCILVHGVVSEPSCKKYKTSIESDSVVHHDIFKRKRNYVGIGAPKVPITVAYYDKNIQNFSKLVGIVREKCEKLEGFHIVSYKEFIFLFGGEFVMGIGNWNKNVWVYDTIREFWERKCVMPTVRRHFESCVCGHYLYIVGGTGTFRIIQDNMLWYNYKDDVWSKLIDLPCPGREIKCCSWNDQLFILNMHKRCGYLYDHSTAVWQKLNIIVVDAEAVISPNKYAVFSYKNSIYVKGKSLMELVIKNQELVVGKCKMFDIEDYIDVRSIVCGDVIYSLYVQNLNGDNVLSLEKYFIEEDTVEFIFKEAVYGTVFNIEGEDYILGPATTIFSFQFHEVVASDVFVNVL